MLHQLLHHPKPHKHYNRLRGNVLGQSKQDASSLSELSRVKSYAVLQLSRESIGGIAVLQLLGRSQRIPKV
jgi:hypothetical protein